MLVFLALATWARWDPLIANVVSVTVGLSLSFFLNRQHTFHVTDRPARRYAVFVCVGLCGMCVQELVIAALAAHAAPLFSTPLVSKLVALVSAGLMQFFLNRSVTFRQR
jgi:putative flippase GtrA